MNTVYNPITMPMSPVNMMPNNNFYQNHQVYPDYIKLIAEAATSEKNDELFYDYLISIAPTEQDKQIIRDIRNDEKKHNIMFKQLYVELTGSAPAPQTNNQDEFEKPKSFCDGIKKALFGELQAVDKYQRILSELRNIKHVNMLIEIITDELKHSSKYNYLYSTNCVNK